jgi:antitoxin component YwqK of YwqJK toxin-antitoxin module
MKKLLFVLTAFLTFSFNLFGQDDANCGIIIDGVKADTLDCWSFNEMDLVFPVNDKYKKYDQTTICLRFSNDAGNVGPECFYYHFSPQSFSDNFGNSPYGVWKFLHDKKNEIFSGVDYQGFPLRYTRKSFAQKHQRVSGWSFQLQIVGEVITGYSYDNNGDRLAEYGNGTFLYKSDKIPFIPSKYNESESCVIPGKKVDIKIEKSPAYQDNLGIIKGGGAPTNTANNTNSSADNTNTTITKSSNNNTVSASPSSGNSASASPSPNNAANLPALDKAKQYYFADKGADGNIIREGYKNGSMGYVGEVRQYMGGKLSTVFTYVKNSYDGPSAQYDTKTGNLIKSCNYKSNKMDGAYSEYDPQTGSLILEGTYKNGKRDGEWKRYRNGKVVGTDTYVDGVKQ